MNKKITIAVLIIVLLAAIVLSAAVFLSKKKVGTVLYARVGGGVVESITENEITVNSNNFNPAAEKTPKPADIFRLNSNCKIYQVTEDLKSQDQYNQEQITFNQLLADFVDKKQNVLGLEPPIRAIEKVTDLKSLQTGAFVRLYGIYTGQQNKNSEIYKIVIDNKFKLNPENPILGMESGTVLNFSGKIISVSSGQIRLAQDIVDPSTASASTSARQIIFRIGSDTKIYKATNKPADKFAAEVQVFNKRITEMENTDKKVDGLNFPEAFSKNLISPNDLKNGDNLSVRASKPQGEEFLAGEIIVY